MSLQILSGKRTKRGRLTVAAWPRIQERIKRMGWGGALYAPPSLSFGLLLKNIMRHPYMKILDLAKLFAADAPMKKIQEI